MSLNIGVVGVGGVGGYFGGKLCRLIAARGMKVHFVARGQHLECIRREGLSVRTEAEGEWTCWPTTVTDSIEELPQLDVCLLCVKSYDLPNAIVQLRRRVSDSTTILPLLNGIDIYDRIRAILRTQLTVAGLDDASTLTEATWAKFTPNAYIYGEQQRIPTPRPSAAR